MDCRMHIGHRIRWYLRSCLWGPGLVALVRIAGSTSCGWLFLFSKVSNIINNGSFHTITPKDYSMILLLTKFKTLPCHNPKDFFNFNFVIVNIFNSSTFKTNFKVYYIVVIKRMMLYNRYLEFISLCLNNFMPMYRNSPYSSSSSHASIVFLCEFY